MASATVKTIETNTSVTDFINALADQQKKADCFQIIELMKQHSGFEPKLWGTGIVGFGSYHYKYESGREGDAPLVAFSPRKAEIVLYLATGFEEKEQLLTQLGKHKTGQSCIYVKTLKNIDTQVLAKMITLSIAHVQTLYS